MIAAEFKTSCSIAGQKYKDLGWWKIYVMGRIHRTDQYAQRMRLHWSMIAIRGQMRLDTVDLKWSVKDPTSSAAGVVFSAILLPVIKVLCLQVYDVTKRTVWENMQLWQDVTLVWFMLTAWIFEQPINTRMFSIQERSFYSLCMCLREWKSTCRLYLCVFIALQIQHMHTYICNA